MSSCLLASCAGDDITEGSMPSNADRIIRVGGISDHVFATRAATSQPAEQIDWLGEALQQGFDVTYGYLQGQTETNVSQAVLTWEGTYNTSSLPEYTFKYKDTDNDAKWYNNGNHFFRGVYVPEDLKTHTGVSADQHLTDGMYTQLSRYISIPYGTKIPATVDRITIPYEHRLARVITYVLIDPELENDDNTKATLKGYTAGGDDPSTTDFRLGNVKVLDFVDGTEPQWIKVRKAIPHFLYERGSQADDGTVYDADQFIVYTNSRGESVYPRDAEWKSIHDAAGHNGYTEKVYGKVPVYDLIVRPTYNSENKTPKMYDEAAGVAVSEDNAFTFETTLSNGLFYNKTYPFDLDPNRQTVLYLTINKEKVDYDASTSSIWTEESNSVAYFGVNNDGFSLSEAGSSWQRAFRIDDVAKKDYVVEHDGKEYWDEDNNGQYVTLETWKSKFIEAAWQSEGTHGANHGDYFILDQDVTFDASELPEDFIFTGHLDARGHTITITDANGSGRNYLFTGMNATYTTAQEANIGNVWEANVHKEDHGTLWVPMAGYRSEIINTQMPTGSLMFSEGAAKDGYIYQCTSNGQEISNTPALPKYN